MHPIAIVNTFVLSSLVAILIFGAVLNIKYRQKNIYRNYLILIFFSWAAMLIVGFGKFYINGASTFEFNADIISVPILFLGVICFISIVSYPIVILDVNRLKFSNGVRLTMPILISLTIYLLWHMITGHDPFIKYATYGELFSDILTISVILRLSLVVSFIIYVIMILLYIWRIIPFYNQYVCDHIANSDCNVEWIRLLVIFIIIFIVSFFAMLFTNSPYVNLICMLSIIPLFGYIVEMSLFHNSSELVVPLELADNGWSYTKPSYRLSGGDYIENITMIRAHEQQIDRWMEKSQSFTKIDFTTKDILEAFPQISNADLAAVFKLKRETFQSYVRAYRINKACKMIDKSRFDLSLSQIFTSVGFSHYSSFSRSFYAVKNMSPSDYLQTVKRQ